MFLVRFNYINPISHAKVPSDNRANIQMVEPAGPKVQKVNKAKYSKKLNVNISK